MTVHVHVPHRACAQVDIPLILTVMIRLAFKAFQLHDAGRPVHPSSFFATQPEGYRKKEPPSLEAEHADAGSELKEGHDEDALWAAAVQEEAAAAREGG